METTVKKITKRDHSDAIISLAAAARSADLGTYDYDALIEFAKNEIALLDKKAESAKARAEKAHVQGDEMRDTIYSILPTDEFVSLGEIAKALGDEDVTPQKISARLGQLVKLNKVERGEISVPATETSKARKLTGYRAL